MHPHFQQKSIRIILYIFGGILALGTLLDSLANAISLITPLVANIGTAFIVLFWLRANIFLRRHPITLVAGTQPIRLRKLGIKPTAYAVGMVLLLWIPWGLTLFHMPPPANNAKKIVEQLVKAHERELVGFRQREQAYQDQMKALTEAVTALAQREGPNIANALARLQQGNTAAAERIFQDILTRKVAEGTTANRQAAEAARHLGALAFLYDTEKALNTYRQAVRLDPENAEGWTQLGHLLLRTGQLDNAADAYRQVLTLGEKASNRNLLASAYGRLGSLSFTRGELDQAEALYRKQLVLEEVVGRKDGMASAYTNLGNMYGRQGDLDQAEALYRKALTLFQEIGAFAQVEQVQKSLRILRAQGSP